LAVCCKAEKRIGSLVDRNSIDESNKKQVSAHLNAINNNKGILKEFGPMPSLPEE